MNKWDVKGKDIEDIISHLLNLRGIVTQEEQERFMSPDWERDIYDPYIFKNMEKAVERLFRALEKGEKIIIHGDYDADGICGASLISSALEELLSYLEIENLPKIDVFLPDREKDGYGVAKHNIEKFAEDKYDLLITVDCGISNIEELALAHENGIDVIICDHHQLAETEPENALIIHPLAKGEVYPNKYLCGTGVAFKLICGLFIFARKKGVEMPDGLEKWYLDLVAIATVTDVMPIIGENRVLEHYGLIVLEKTRRVGLEKIIQQANLKSIDTEAIGFRIGPRINAAGRIGNPLTAFEAITAKTPEIAEERMYSLELLNRQRQKISDAAYKEAKKIVENEDDSSIFVVWNKDWHPGIVGLIAGKLTTEFGVPAFALTNVNQYYVGSGRSVGGLHLVEAMKSCGDIFVKAGGHPQACGLTIKEDFIPEFKKGVNLFAEDFFKNAEAGLKLEIDAEIPISQVDWNLVNGIQKLQPFGEGNKTPVFLSRQVEILDIRTVGKKDKHLKLSLASPINDGLDAIGFSFGEYYNDLIEVEKVDIVYEIGINEWFGRKSIQLMIKDISI